MGTLLAVAMTEAARHPVRAITRTREDVAGHRAASRVSAYIYGDVLVLAATAGVSVAAVRSGQAAFVVLGTVLSTYLAHVLADVVGAVLIGDSWRSAMRAEVRDAVPILSAGTPTCALLGAATLGWPPARWAQVLASAYVVVRVAGIGLVYRRLHPHVSLARAVGFGLVTGAAIAVAVAVKLALAH